MEITGLGSTLSISKKVMVPTESFKVVRNKRKMLESDESK